MKTKARDHQGDTPTWTNKHYSHTWVLRLSGYKIIWGGKPLRLMGRLQAKNNLKIGTVGQWHYSNILDYFRLLCEPRKTAKINAPLTIYL